MALITIMRGAVESDKSVIVDGEAFYFDIDPFIPDTSIWAVTWDGASGEVEYIGIPPLSISSIADYQAVLDEWQVYKTQADIDNNPPPTPEEILIIEMAASGVTASSIAGANYLAYRGLPSSLSAIDAAIDAKAVETGLSITDIVSAVTGL
jgi:hypothetical protein